MSTVDEENVKRAVLLRAARNMLGLSLKQVGEQVGVTSAGAGKWETGLSPIKPQTFNQLEVFYRYHGVIMELDAEGRPLVRLSEKGLDLLKENPKKPEITSLIDIYFETQKEEGLAPGVAQLLLQSGQLRAVRSENPDLNESELEEALTAMRGLNERQWEELLPKLKKWLSR